MRVVFFGMECAGSERVLAALQAGGVEVRAVVLPVGRGRGAASAESGVGRLADGTGVPLVGVARLDGEAIGAIAAWRPEEVVAACFPWRLPPELLAVPPLGCLNVHPSLLPVGRGPEPVFWTLRRGERRTGATVHLMDAGFDTGPIVARAEVAVPEGVRAPELEARLMALGGRLVVEALAGLAVGTTVPTPQEDALATRAPVPAAADWVVPTNLPGRWAFSFARGVAPLGGPLMLLVGATGGRYPIRDALGYAADERMEAPVEDEGGGVLRARCRPGWVRLLVG